MSVGAPLLFRYGGHWQENRAPTEHKYQVAGRAARRMSPHGKRALTAGAVRLARYFGTTARFWLNLQTQHDLDPETDRLGKRLDTEITVRAS